MTTATPTPITLGLRRFWRIPVAAFVGAILGFGASFIFGVSYSAKARVLMHVNNLTLLQTNGSTVVNQMSQAEQAAIGQAMAETQSALLDNRAVAQEIVRKLHLDKKPPGGFVNAVKSGISTTFKWTQAMIIHGTYKKLSRFEQAVQNTQKGLSAHAVGFSWELEVSGQWRTREKAAAIANLAADYLVRVGEQRFQDDVAANTKNLQEQVRVSGERQQKAAAELAAFAAANGLDVSKLGLALTPEVAMKLAPAAQAQYQVLQSEYNTSLAAFGQLQAQYQQAQVYAGVKPVELTRVDKAVPGVYPVKPKRWLYLAIGIVLGSLVGLGLTARWFWRRGETMFPRDDEYRPRRDGGASGATPLAPVAVANEPSGSGEPDAARVPSDEGLPPPPEGSSASRDEIEPPSEPAPPAPDHPEQYGSVRPTTPGGTAKP
ncbi:MAG: hypothetical protein U0V73_12415 [Acidimicrobiia bacterium]